jgi:4-hydroxybutyrate CoA-transferase
MSCENAIKAVKSGDRVVVGHAAGEPVVLIEELVRQKDRLQNVEIVHMVPMGKCEYCQNEGLEKHIRHNSLFAGAPSRTAIAQNRADYTPVFFSEVPRLFKNGILPVDVALIQVSPPDKDGDCSYGISVDYTKAAAESAKIVIAEINSQMPRTYGSFINISDIDFIVETNRPIVELQPPKISEIEEKIGANVASLIEHGSNLQLGIGAIPDAALHFLKDKKDLGIHTEMFSDGVVDLYRAGVITNKFNNLHLGKFTATFLMGTQKLYDFVDNNPDINMQPVDYTNNILVAGQVKKLVSINSAIQVDLWGQVCADTMGSRQFSGVGGQVDFVRAASVSEGGKSIIAMPSTAKNGAISRIVLNFEEGACVTTSRNDVHYIVTEYGTADLRGKTTRQRAKELINIAHPDFRQKLEKQAAEKGLTDAKSLYNMC